MDDEEHHVDHQQVAQATVDGGGGEAAADKQSGRLRKAEGDEASEAMHAPQKAQAAAPDEQEDEEPIPYPEPENEETTLFPPPDFKSFFTLIEDSNGDHHHPYVHYIFGDDDPEILTNAALQTLSPHDGNMPEERFVVVDMAADGKEVVSVSSLSPDWQALTTKMSPAPSWNGGSEKDNADRGTMLTIHGHEARAHTAAIKGKKKKGGGVETLLKAFDANLGFLDGVLGAEVTNVDTHTT